jgi:hypothetical protein
MSNANHNFIYRAPVLTMEKVTTNTEYLAKTSQKAVPYALQKLGLDVTVTSSLRSQLTLTSW